MNYKKALDDIKEKKSAIKKAKMDAAELVLAKSKTESEKKMTTFKCDLSTLQQSLIAHSEWDKIVTDHNQYVNLYGD